MVVVELIKHKHSYIYNAVLIERKSPNKSTGQSGTNLWGLNLIIRLAR